MKLPSGKCVKRKPSLVVSQHWCNQATSHYLSQCWPRFLCYILSLGHSELRLLMSSVWNTCNSILPIYTQIAKFMGPAWGPPGACWPQMGPTLAPWTLLSGYLSVGSLKYWISLLTNLSTNVAVPEVALIEGPVLPNDSGSEWTSQCDSHWLRNKYYHEYDWTLAMCMPWERQAIVGCCDFI